MRVLHVVSSMSAAMGGLSAAVANQVLSLRDFGVNCEVVSTIRHPSSDGMSDAEGKIIGESLRHIHFRRQSDFYWFSWPLLRWLWRNVSNYDLVHVHGLFNFASNAGGYAALFKSVPFVVQPHGMLHKYSLTYHKPFLKKLSMSVLERRLLLRARAVIYTTHLELEEAEAAGVGGRGVIVPLGLDIRQFVDMPSRDAAVSRWPVLRGKRVILFMSRIHVKKRLELLLESLPFVLRHVPDACLLVAGDGDPGYVSRLVEMTRALGIEHAVVWVGFITGEAKMLAFAACDVFVLPSYSENFGVVVAEAMACGKPCIITPGVAIASEIERAGAGFVVQPKPEELAEVILRVLGDTGLAGQVARNGKNLVEKRFSLEATGRMLYEVYRRALAEKQ